MGFAALLPLKGYCVQGAPEEAWRGLQRRHRHWTGASRTRTSRPADHFLSCVSWSRFKDSKGPSHSAYPHREFRVERSSGVAFIQTPRLRERSLCVYCRCFVTYLWNYLPGFFFFSFFLFFLSSFLSVFQFLPTFFFLINLHAYLLTTYYPL